MGEITDERASSPQGLLQSDDSDVSSTSFELAPSVAGLAITNADNARASIKCRWSSCGLWFGHLDLLASHVTRDHARSGQGGLFYCGWEGCSRGDRGFNARYKMLVHVRTHTNEKPHRCSQCAKSFSRAENLKIHARSHTGERPYVCTVVGCGKAYSNSSDRFKHTRTHSVDKPYVCKVPGCPKRYTDPSSLRKHVKTYRHYADDGTIPDEAYSPVERETPKVLKRDSNGVSKIDFNNTTSFADQICDKNVTKDSSDSRPELFVNGQGTQYDLFRSWLNADLAVLSRSLPLGLSLWDHPLLQKDPRYALPKSLYEGHSVKHSRMDSASSESSVDSNEDMSNDQESPLDLTIHRASTRT